MALVMIKQLMTISRISNIENKIIYRMQGKLNRNLVANDISSL